MTAAAEVGAKRGGGFRLPVILAVVAAVVVIFLTARATPMPPFSIDDSSPGGYRALALLLEEQGAQVGTASSSQIEQSSGPLDAADAIVVPTPSRLSVGQLDALDERAAAGTTVVLGAPVEIDDSESWLPDSFEIPDRALADVEAQPVPPGVCTIAVLDGLGAIDAAFSVPISVRGQLSCFGSDGEAYVVERSVGDGSVATLADPWLWVNARLQPTKESGGQPLDNAAMALRLLRAAPGTDVRFVESYDAAGGPVGGTRGPLELLPLPVQLALVMGLAALAFFLWWRGRRLGQPITEPLPVEIQASELVAAVGDVLRRRGSTTRAAAALRDDVRRELATRLGVPPGQPPELLVQQVAARTGRPADAVRAVLVDPTPPRDEDLVRLARELDLIRQEALDDQPVR